MAGSDVAATEKPWELDAVGPATQAPVMLEKELRSGCQVVDMEHSLDQAHVSTVPRGDLARERLVNESQALAMMLRHAAPPACRHLQRVAWGGIASRVPGMVCTGGQMRIGRNHG
jgi:hypothetical protein